ncbi:MAG: hypothetical protein ABFS42_11980 [Candidatus Krumholzibacteriota bacterium]
MNPHQAGARIVILALALSVGLLVAGCGEKIAIPVPSGDFSVNRYIISDTFQIDGSAIQMTQARGLLYVLHEDLLTKRDTKFEIIEQVPGLLDPLALCVDEQGDFIFVWENGAQRVTWFDAGSLDMIGSTSLPDVQTAVSLATNQAGIDQVPGGRTFIYLSDPLTGVIHRYSFNESSGLEPYGILARSGGAGARFVNDPAGLASDFDGRLLVCDIEVPRNWVIRFDSTPDQTDTAIDPNDPDPMRGLAVLFDEATCEPPAATDFVLGNAAECEESTWEGGPSDEVGEFDRPLGVAVDGIGRIFIADTGNSRIQMFTPQGEYDLQFVASDTLSGPTSLAVFDEDGKQPNTLNYGAFVFASYVDRDIVVKFISLEHYYSLNDDPPPE